VRPRRLHHHHRGSHRSSLLRPLRHRGRPWPCPGWGRPAQAGERTVPSPGPHDNLEVTSRHHAVDHPGGQVLE